MFLLFRSDKEASVMRANSWLYQYYSLHSKMHYGLAYEAHPSRLPTYYNPMMPYHPSPTEAAVPHSPYHLHPPVSLPQPQAPPPPTTVLQYGGVPYTSLPAEPEQARWPTTTTNHTGGVKRPASPTSIGSPSKSPATRASSSSPPVEAAPAANLYSEMAPSGYYGSTQVSGIAQLLPTTRNLFSFLKTTGCIW